jgi:rod shape-determining protein MreD
MRWLIPLLAVAAVLQSIALPGLTGNSVRPDVALVLVIGWAAIRGWEEGVIVGILGGMFLDFLSATPFGVNMFRYAVLGAVAGLVIARLTRTGPLLAFAAAASCCLLAYVLTIVALQATGRAVPLDRSFLLAVLPSAALTVVCMAALFPLFRAVERRLNTDDLGLGRDA